MRVYIGPYKNWFGPHQLAERLCFWAKGEGKRDYPEYVFRLGEWLAYGKWRGVDEIPQHHSLFPSRDEEEVETWLYRAMLWIDKRRARRVEVRIDPYDTWSMDTTLAPIILPMLKQLQATKHGSPLVDLEDVPEYLRTTNTEPYDSQMVFEFYTEQEGDIHKRWDWVLNEMIFAFERLCDDDSITSHECTQSRIDNGLRLFGKYYQGLWD